MRKHTTPQSPPLSEAHVERRPVEVRLRLEVLPEAQLAVPQVLPVQALRYLEVWGNPSCRLRCWNVLCLYHGGAGG